MSALLSTDSLLVHVRLFVCFQHVNVMMLIGVKGCLATSAMTLAYNKFAASLVPGCVLDQ